MVRNIIITTFQLKCSCLWLNCGLEWISGRHSITACMYLDGEYKTDSKTVSVIVSEFFIFLFCWYLCRILNRGYFWKIHVRFRLSVSVNCVSRSVLLKAPDGVVFSFFFFLPKEKGVWNTEWIFCHIKSVYTDSSTYKCVNLIFMFP